MAITLEPRTTGLAPAPAAVIEPVVPARRPGREPGAVPALLADHVTKRFVVGRKKKAVIAVDDVSLRIERGEVGNELHRRAPLLQRQVLDPFEECVIRQSSRDNEHVFIHDSYVARGPALAFRWAWQGSRREIALLVSV